MGIFGQSAAGQPRNDGELHNLQVTEAVFGTCLPILIGTARLHGKLLFYGGFYATKAPNSGGKGVFGGKATEFDYYADVIQALCQGPTYGLLSIWDQNGKLANQGGSYVYTVPVGGGSVAPITSPSIQQDLGVTKATAYSVTANDYGAGGEVTLSGTMQTPLKLVTGTPGAGEYSFNPATSTYTFSSGDGGTEVTISFSCVFSLYYFIQAQEAEIPTNSPFQVSTDNESYFEADQGVYFIDDGVQGTKVGSPSASHQYSESNGVYTFYSADAGKFVRITYEYTSSDPDLTNSSKLNLTFFNGAQSQAPWSYMTSKYPGSAFGYSNICYVGANPMALGETASMPSYNYEVVGRAIFGGGNYDALVADAMEILLTDPLCGINFPLAWLGDWTLARAYHASNGFFISEALDTQQPIAQVMQRWLDAGNVAAVWSAGTLKLIPYGDTTTVGNGYTYTPPTTPAVTLTWDDILPWSDGNTGTTQDDPIQISLKAPQDCLNYVQCQYTNRSNDYNNDLIPEQNDAFIELYGFRPESPQTWDFITTEAGATFALNLRLKRNCYIRAGYRWRLPFCFSALEPMDLVVLPTGEDVRILQVDDDPNGALTITAEQWSYGTANVTLYPKQAPSSYQPNISQALPGDTTPVFLQSSSVQAIGTENQLQIAAIGQSNDWGGCVVYVSNDGETYSSIGRITSTGIIGRLTAALPLAADPDTSDTLSIDITLSLLGDAAAELVTVTQQQADNFVSLCAIVDQGGLTNELVSYETATLTGTGRYNLSYIRRGVYGTTAAAHTSGASFAFLGPGYDFLKYQYYPQYVGQSLYVKLASFNLAGNQQQDLSQCKAWQLFIGRQGSNIVETYVPSSYTETTISGGATITNPTAAYDLNFATAADLACSTPTGANNEAYIVFKGFPSAVTVSVMTLYVSFTWTKAAGSFSGDNQMEGVIIASLNNGSSFAGMATPFNVSQPGGSGSGTGSLSIPAGTNLSQVEVAAFISGPGEAAIGSLSIYEVWIQ